MVTKLTDNPDIQDILTREKALQDSGAYVYMKEIEGTTNRTVMSGGSEMIMLGSYSYLGLIDHPEIMKASEDALRKYGAGAGGVRLLTGTTTIHKELEDKLAKFKKTEDAIVFSSGFMTNIAVLSSLFDQRDLIVIDRFAHQSIYDGAGLSKAKWMKFRHNDLDHLRAILKLHRPNYKRVVIVVDAVYSMDGDIAPMPEIIEIAKEYDAFTMVDEAHSIGVLGEKGTGIEEYFGLDPDAIDLKMGTFSKSIPSIGGYLAAKKDVITYLRFTGHPFVFSAALPPASVGAAMKALDVILAEPERVKMLHKNIDYFLNGVKALGFDVLKSKDTAIIPVMIGDNIQTFGFAKAMHDAGIFVSPIVYPAVPHDGGRLRCCVMATHTKEDLDKVIGAMGHIGKAMGIIK